MLGRRYFLVKEPTPEVAKILGAGWAQTQMVSVLPAAKQSNDCLLDVQVGLR